jgi:hypothetical protein
MQSALQPASPPLRTRALLLGIGRHLNHEGYITSEGLPQQVLASP